jgi:tetratricopeptide (TPR) repeat protein
MQMALLDSEALLDQTALLEIPKEQQPSELLTRTDQAEETTLLSGSIESYLSDTPPVTDNQTPDSNAMQASLITPDIQQTIEQAQTFLDSLESSDELPLNQMAFSDETVILSEVNAPLPAMGNSLPENITLKAYHEAKYDAFLKAGHAYLKQGQFQRAEDAFALAGVYRTNDAEAWAGRSVALLAKEEYASSALFLRRALRIVPDYAKIKLDLPSLVGGMDAVVKHVKALKSFQDNPHTPDLHDLLAYVYLQMNDLSLAQEILDKDVITRPNDVTIKALRAALNKAIQD